MFFWKSQHTYCQTFFFHTWQKYSGINPTTYCPNNVHYTQSKSKLHCAMFLCSIVNKRLPSGQGRYHLKMIPYEDAGFRFPLTRSRNLEMEIDQRLYIEVQTMGVDERQISTILDSCWATPFNDASYPVRWNLISEE